MVHVICEIDPTVRLYATVLLLGLTVSVLVVILGLGRWLRHQRARNASLDRKSTSPEQPDPWRESGRRFRMNDGPDDDRDT